MHSVGVKKRIRTDREKIEPGKLDVIFGSEPKEDALSEISDKLIDGDTVELISDINEKVVIHAAITIIGNGHKIFTRGGGLNLHNHCEINDCHFMVGNDANGIVLRKPDLELFLKNCTFEHISDEIILPSIFMIDTINRIMCDNVNIDTANLNTRYLEGTSLRLGKPNYKNTRIGVKSGDKYEMSKININELELIRCDVYGYGFVKKLIGMRIWITTSTKYDLKVSLYQMNVQPFLKVSQLMDVETGLMIVGNVQIENIDSFDNLNEESQVFLKERVKLFYIKAPNCEVTISGRWQYPVKWVSQVWSGNVHFKNYSDVNKIYFKSEDAVVDYVDSHFTYVKDYKPKPKIKTAQEKLNEMVGLSDVKKKVNAYIATNLVNEKRKELGQPVSANSLHLIFSGAAGTGKTEVARLLAKILYDNKIISKPDIKEATAKDMIAGYMGQTSIKTHELIMEAKGGILFIDEAYELDPSNDGGSDSYKREAITTLVKDMDDFRSDLIVIMAGYSQEMQQLLQANSGLPSRFVNIIEFPDYSAQELCEIAQLQATQLKQVMTDEAKQKLTEYIQSSKQSGVVDGNGRWVRNL